jgi:hypothetical protein
MLAFGMALPFLPVGYGNSVTRRTGSTHGAPRRGGRAGARTLSARPAAPAGAAGGGGAPGAAEPRCGSARIPAARARDAGAPGTATSRGSRGAPFPPSARRTRSPGVPAPACGPPGRPDRRTQRRTRTRCGGKTPPTWSSQVRGALIGAAGGACHCETPAERAAPRARRCRVWTVSDPRPRREGSGPAAFARCVEGRPARRGLCVRPASPRSRHAPSGRVGLCPPHPHRRTAPAGQAASCSAGSAGSSGPSL